MYEFKHVLKIEICGQERTAVVTCVADVDDFSIEKVEMERLELAEWLPNGSYIEGRVIRHTVDVTALLDEDQNRVIKDEIREFLAREAFETMAEAA